MNPMVGFKAPATTVNNEDQGGSWKGWRDDTVCEGCADGSREAGRKVSGEW